MNINPTSNHTSNHTSNLPSNIVNNIIWFLSLSQSYVMNINYINMAGIGM